MFRITPGSAPAPSPVAATFDGSRPPPSEALSPVLCALKVFRRNPGETFRNDVLMQVARLRQLQPEAYARHAHRLKAVFDTIEAMHAGKAASPVNPAAAELWETKARELLSGSAGGTGPDAPEALASARAYLAQCRALLNGNLSPEGVCIQQDRQQLPLVIESENHRDPGLNLVYCESYVALARLVTEVAAGIEGAFRGRVIARQSDGTDAVHHVVVDVRIASGEPPSLLVFEPALSDLSAFQMAKYFHDTFPDVRISFVNLKAQASRHDCLAFSQVIARKLHDACAVIDRIHEAQLSGVPLEGADGRSFLFGQAPPDNEFYQRDAAQLLPAAFFKHTQSWRSLKQVLDANPALAHQPVRYSGDTLQQAHGRYRVERDGRGYANMIEHRRMRILERAVSHAEERAGGRASAREDLA